MDEYIVITFQGEGLEYKATIVEAESAFLAARKAEKQLDAWWYEVYNANLQYAFWFDCTMAITAEGDIR